MTKKDYELIAGVIAGSKGHIYPDGINQYVRELVAVFCFRLLKDNPRFDTKKFIKACKV